MKKLFFLTAFLLMCCSAFAYDGAVCGHKKLYVHKTEWFDVIYAAENEKTAEILVQNADRIYSEVAGQYGIEPQCRMPLVITQQVEEFNANWSAYPYNHIVMYDTGVPKSLAVFEDSILGTFRHEITHSVTYNMKNGFWRALDKVFGDPIYPAITITSGMAEGAAVTSESALEGGKFEGRLNNEYARHSVKQSKIEGTFPYYSDVQGASDKYPTGSFYQFNAAFYQWVQEKFGLERYADYWYRLINLTSISASGAFKKAFGMSLRAAWKQFEKDYQVPVSGAQKNPVAAGLAKDFFNPASDRYSGKNDAGALYTSLCKSDKGLYYLDSRNHAVYFSEKKKKLFELHNIDSISVSSDGRFIAALYLSKNKSASKAKSAVFDTKNHRLFLLSDENVHKAAVLCKKDSYYLVQKIYDSPLYKIRVSKINLKENGNFSGLSDGMEIALSYGSDVLSVCDAPDDTFAFIKNSGMNYSLCQYELNGNPVFENSFPCGSKGRIFADNLFYDSKSEAYYFSWVESGSMPRLGKYSLKDKAFLLSENDYSGGIFYPVFDDGKLYYIGNFFRQNRILILNENETKEFSEAADDSDLFYSDTMKETMAFVNEGSGIELSKKPYNRMNFMRGTILPYSICTSNSYNYSHKTKYALPFGFTYINTNPWTAGLFNFSVGYGVATNSFGMKISYSSGTFTEVFKYNAGVSTEFDDDGWKQAAGTLGLNSTIPFGRISNWISSGSIILHYGRSNSKTSKFPGDAKSRDSENYLYVSNSLQTGYSNIRRTGDGKYSYGGFSLSGVLSAKYNADDPRDRKKYTLTHEAGLLGIIKIPRLLPVRDFLNYTCNLPCVIEMEVFAEKKKGTYSQELIWRPAGYPEFDAVSTDFSFILFGVDVQKGAGILFFNDLRLEFGYKVGFSYFMRDTESWKIGRLDDYLPYLGDRVPLEQQFSLRVAAGITPNYGILANKNYKGDFFLEFGMGLKNSSIVSTSQTFTKLGVNLSI